MNLLKNPLFWLLVVPIACSIQEQKTFTFKCFDRPDKIHPRYPTKNYTDSIGIQVSDRVTHQLVSRIYAIFLREVLGYDRVKLVSNLANKNDNEKRHMFLTLENLAEDSWPISTIDLEVFMLPDYHIIPPEIEEAGQLTNPGRFSFFIPKKLLSKSVTVKKQIYPYTIFQREESDNYEMFKRFIVDSDVHQFLIQYTNKEYNGTFSQPGGIYQPDQCQNTTKCAALLTSSYNDMKFVVNHIKELKLSLNVYWLDKNLKHVVKSLLELYSTNSTYLKQSSNFLVLHWTPSEIIDGSIEFIPMQMPRCEEIVTRNVTGCKYEMIPILKYYTSELKSGPARMAQVSLLKYGFSTKALKSMIAHYERYEDELNWPVLSQSEKTEVDKITDEIYNKVACEWLKENPSSEKYWKPQGETEEKIYIGGIFPVNVRGNNYPGIMAASRLAERAINSNPDILPNFKLSILTNDGECKADSVMKKFIDYYMKQTRLIGVLGPACSDTVEPIAGVSKHLGMTVISYSAEGVSFADRKTYPYFFRTIGENRQYEEVYVNIFKQLKWNRVAALSEDGKHTEYINHLEHNLKENNVHMITTRKFPRDISENDMKQYLLELKNNNAKIIIADINDQTAQMILCEAFKLQMIAKYNYVWFLPVWITKEKILNASSTSIKNNTISCSMDDIREALNGHFSLSHAPFGEDKSMMQENITVDEWRKEYLRELQLESGNSENITDIRIPVSDYGAYAYDAVWVYAKCLNQLIKEDSKYLSDLHSPNTTNRLVELIWGVDFNGASGRIKFGPGGSRLTVINILQWVNEEFRVVGTFKPAINATSGNRIEDQPGSIRLDESLIVWNDGIKPDDGTTHCFLSSLPELLGVECQTILTIFITFICIIIVIVLSFFSFWYWKRRYDKKLERSAKIMKNFGIDLFGNGDAANGHSLDKFELPKDRVVINRRLGIGAFGTVYGGEALINENEGWTGVAIKTLKVGSTTEDRLDFLSEAEAMKRFDHKNIVKLLGVCLTPEPVFTIMELMIYGDLKTFLLARRHLVNEKITEDSDIHPKRLTMMALDVSRALSYLASQKYVHRDVACRNCLVSVDRVVKLGDFGMSRPMYESDYYRFNRKGMLPVRWMSPESLELGIFTPSSDVWSYGVMLFEIITFGSFPFQGMTNNQVLEHVKKGNTLEIPRGVKPQLEGLLKSCWNPDYKKRPKSSEISEFISSYPRLVTPCLDVPLSAVQMHESESDQLELLPGFRKRSFTPSQQPNSSKQISPSTSTLTLQTDIRGSAPTNFLELQQAYNNCNGIYHDDSNNPNGNGHNIYNPIEPLLLKRGNEMSKSNTSLMRYVPMCGFGSKNRSTSLERNCTSIL